MRSKSKGRLELELLPKEVFEDEVNRLGIIGMAKKYGVDKSTVGIVRDERKIPWDRKAAKKRGAKHWRGLKVKNNYRK